MALDTVPWIIDGTTIDGEVIRRALGTLLASSGGIVTPGDLAVTQQGTPNMSVAVAAGQIWVPGTSTSSQGPYYARNGASVTLAIAASNPSNPRLDQVIAQVEDAAYAGSSKLMQLAVVTGTPTSGASLTNLVGLGSVPASSMVLANVLVPANATSITTADIGNVQPHLQMAPTLPDLAIDIVSSSLTAAVRTCVIASPGDTITLPTPFLNARVQVQAGGSVSGSSPVTVQTSGGASIYNGLGVQGVTSVLLGAPGSYMVFQCHDGANWSVVGGQRDTGWIALSVSSPLTTPGAGIAVRQIGDRVWFDGAVYNPTSSTFSGGTQWSSLPAGITAPTSAKTLNATAPANSINALGLQVSPSGAIQFEYGLALNTYAWADGLSYAVGR